MSTFNIKFRTSSNARANALKQGRVLPGEMIINVDPAGLSAEERELILKIGTPTAGSTIETNCNLLPDGETLSDVLAAIRKKEEEKAMSAEREKLADARRIEEYKDAARKYAAGEDVYISNPSNPNTGDAELDAAVIAEYERKQAVNTAAEKEKSDARESAVNDLKEWALQFGTDHLKDLITEGFNWKEVARKEWISAHTPEGFFDVGEDDEYEDSYEIRNPSPKAIQVLRETRETHPDCCLLRVKFEDGTHKDYISVLVRPPFGDAITVERFIETYSTPE